MWLCRSPTAITLLLIVTAGLVTSTHPDIDISPSQENRTIFQEGSFRRTCRYTGSQNVSELQLLRNGEVFDQEGSDASSVMLDVMEAQQINAGSYTCRIVFSDSTSISESMGTLTVVDLSLITAPANQYVVTGEDVRLQCQFHDPEEQYGTVIITIRRGSSQTVQMITGASVEDEGDYECDVNLINSDSTQVPITLHVFTPINITGSPVNYQELVGVQEASFTVSFMGRESQDIATMWFRNGVILRNTTEHRIMTTFNKESLTGSTTIHFPQMDRGDGGVYRVVISTNFGGDMIAASHKRREDSFQVYVRVPPPDPINFETLVVAEHHVQLQWELPFNHPDEDVQSFQLEINFPNGSTATSMTLDSSARTADVSVFPGVDNYEAHLIARNSDGLGERRLLFSTPPAAPYVTNFESRRLNETHFNISISLLYTGGGDTTTFYVYFRELNHIEWSPEPIMIVVLDSASTLEFQFHGTISAEEIRGKGPLEFELRVENGLGFMNRTGSGLEISDPPGAPTTPTVSETSDTSVTLDFRLPQEGTPPFINIVLEFSEPQVMTRNFTGSYTAGQTVTKEVHDLSPKTNYTLKARAVNYAGNGPSSDTIHFTTEEAPPTTPPTPDPMSSMPWLLPAVGGGAFALVLVIGVATLAGICYCCYAHKKKKRQRGDSFMVGKNNQSAINIESGRLESDINMGQLDKGLAPHTALLSPSSLDNKPTPGNTYSTPPQHNHPPTTSSTRSDKQWPLEKGHNQASSSTLNSGRSATQDKQWPLEKGHNQASSSTLNSGRSATQDSFVKKDIYSTGSDIQIGSLHSSMHSHRTSKESIGFYRRPHRVVNPSISSGGSEATTEITDQATPCLSPQIAESMSFIPEGSSYCSSLSCSVEHSTQSQYTDV